MKIRILLGLFMAMFIQTRSQACANYNYDIDTESPGTFCNETASIYVYSREHIDARDYVRLTLQQSDGNGGWTNVTAATSEEASNYSSGPCYDIPWTFEVNPSYNGTNVYHVIIQVYRYNKTLKIHELVGQYTTGQVEPWSYKPTNILSLGVKNTQGNTVSWASACISGEFELDVNFQQGATYNAEYEFKVYESNSAGAQISVLNSSTGVWGENFGDFSTPAGSSMSSWLNNTVYSMFNSELSSSSGGYLLFELNVVNPDCGTTSSASTLLEVRTAPYISSFYFEWNHDNNGTTPVVPVQISNDQNNPVTIGGISGVLISDISTQYYESYTFEVHKKVGTTYIPIASDQVNSIGGMQFQLNPNSATLLPGYTIYDLPINNPGDLYKVFLTVSTTGCSSSTEWSYYMVDPNKTYYKGNLGEQEKELTTTYHFVNREEASLNLKGFEDWDARNLKLSIISMDGRTIYSGNSAEYNLDATGKAVYLVFVTENDKIIYQSKFVW